MRLLTQYTTINKLFNALTAQIGLRSSPVQGIDKVHTRPLGNAARNNKAAQTGRIFFEPTFNLGNFYFNKFLLGN